MKTRSRLLTALFITSLGASLAAVMPAFGQPATSGCNPAGVCVSTVCIKPCYLCCNNNCTNMVDCQNWCDSRGLTCHETPCCTGGGN